MKTRVWWPLASLKSLECVVRSSGADLSLSAGPPLARQYEEQTALLRFLEDIQNDVGLNRDAYQDGDDFVSGANETFSNSTGDALNNGTDIFDHYMDDVNFTSNTTTAFTDSNQTDTGEGSVFGFNSNTTMNNDNNQTNIFEELNATAFEKDQALDDNATSTISLAPSALSTSTPLPTPTVFIVNGTNTSAFEDQEGNLTEYLSLSPSPFFLNDTNTSEWFFPSAGNSSNSTASFSPSLSPINDDEGPLLNSTGGNTTQGTDDYYHNIIHNEDGGFNSTSAEANNIAGNSLSPSMSPTISTLPPPQDEHQTQPSDPGDDDGSYYDYDDNQDFTAGKNTFGSENPSDNMYDYSSAGDGHSDNGPTVALVLVVFVIGFLFTLYEMDRNPDSVFANLIRCVGYVLWILISLPFKLIFELIGAGRSGRNNDYSDDDRLQGGRYSSSRYRDERFLPRDLELT